VELPLIYNGTPAHERRERAMKALTAVDLKERMFHRPNELSGGQRQRLLIARALVLKPKIVLMDEATSALDNNTQFVITESLSKMNATRIVIAHRLSTIRDADRIYVVESGLVVQVGSFDELVQQEGGLFARLAARQLE
jgi:ABC-type bacteriocin/lantibiotic exporter with double-glycine peptidase domain